MSSSRRIGNYQITDYVGSGGFGSVFKAEDVNTPGRVVAIKELHKKHTRNAVIKQRFFQEAVAMARLDHPSLPRLFTFGEDNGSYYLVMEFISGKVLTDEIQAMGSLSPARAASIIEQVLEALSYAHRNGIIHRDLKPDNIILVEDGGRLTVKVLDFGIARMVGGENLTLAGEGFGTPAYMSPERIAGGGGDDPRIDIYAAGIILFEMLSGKAPFESKATDPAFYWSEMRKLHSSEPLPSLSAFGVPESLENLIRRASAKRLEDRYPTANEMLDDIRSAGLIDATRADLAPTAMMSNARLAVSTAPGDADVFVDDVRRGTSEAVRGKLLIEGLAAGLHNVRVSKEGYNDYRISVSLEDGRQTDLQVALAARATIAMPRSEDTAAGGFETLKLQGADDQKTALLVVESLPVGSTLFVGSEAVGHAGEDGRATIKLKPGEHEVRVTVPSGASAKSVVTVAPEESGSTKTIAFPLAGVPTVQAPLIIHETASRTGKRVAVAAAVALLLAVVAAAYFVIRGPDRHTEITSSAQAVAQLTAPEAPPVAQPSTTPTEAAAKKADEDRSKALSDAEKVALEKKLVETEKKLAEEKKAAEKNAAKPAAPLPSVAAPSNPEPPKQQPAPVEANDACVLVLVTAPGGQPASGMRVGVMEPTNPGATSFNGRTGPKGRWQTCGLRGGQQIRVGVFGPRGALLGGKQMVLTRGQNLVEIQINREFNPDAQPFDKARKRPGYPLN
ncbi:MAG TPA: serine/threonine-protein kinase [Blastocatellia bacterium]|nr:serine/threonine-protein kinase [Blastocatellia bacterium]